MSAQADRLDLAKAIPILEVADRLHIAGLKRASLEHIGPCPVCGGKDRFSINPNKNIFNCRICARGGDQIALVELVQGCDFKQALGFLVGDEIAEIPPEVLAHRRAQAQKRQAKNEEHARIARNRAVSAARNIWDKAAPAKGTMVEAYLQRRGLAGIGRIPPTIKFIERHPYFIQSNSGRRELHRGPCMIAAIQAANGKVRAVHQTWLNLDQPNGKAVFVDGDKKLPSKKVLGSKKGGAIRLSKLISPILLVVGEGIETTLTAMQAGLPPGATYWAGVDLGNMAGRQERVQGKRHSGLPDMADGRAFVPPIGTEKLVFIQDGDSDANATRAKLLAGCRRAMTLRPGLVAEIVHAGKGVDLNDLVDAKGDL